MLQESTPAVDTVNDEDKFQTLLITFFMIIGREGKDWHIGDILCTLCPQFKVQS